MLRMTMVNIFDNIWPMLLIFGVVLITLRLSNLIVNKKPIILYKEFINLLFILYVLSFFHVVTFQDVSWSTSNFIPFKEMFRYEMFSKLFFKNVIGNMIMFMPYGLFIGRYVKTKNIFLATFLILILSITIEVTQLTIGRVFDVDDIMLNVIGGIIGFSIYLGIDCIGHNIPKIFKKEIIYNIACLIITVLSILYFTNVIKFGGI